MGQQKPAAGLAWGKVSRKESVRAKPAMKWRSSCKKSKEMIWRKSVVSWKSYGLCRRAQLSGWRRKPAWMQQCRLLSPQAVRKQSSWKQGHEKQRSSEHPRALALEHQAEAAAAGEELTGPAARKAASQLLRSFAARKRRLEAEKLRAEATSERQRMARFGQAVRRAQRSKAEIPSITLELEDDAEAEDVKKTVIAKAKSAKDTKTKTDPQVKKDKRSKKMSSSSGKGKRRKKEASREEVRRKAEEAARRWQERDDQLEASIRVVEQRGAKAAAEKEALRRAEKERQLRAAERRREAEARRSRSRRRRRRRSSS
ncbi:unnamed protein product [Symbiodinium sp. CCMP2592]|nr:unnamed protein product [Symbiodinium sp. CCMP2592]